MWGRVADFPPVGPLGAQNLPGGRRQLPEGSGRVAQRRLAEPAQQGGPVQQFFGEQPAGVPHGAQLPPGKPMALSGDRCKLPGLSAFVGLLIIVFEKIICIPSPQAPQSSCGLFGVISPPQKTRAVSPRAPALRGPARTGVCSLHWVTRVCLVAD